MRGSSDASTGLDFTVTYRLEQETKTKTETTVYNIAPFGGAERVEGSEPSFIRVCSHTTPQIIVHKVPFHVRYQNFETFKFNSSFAPFLLNLFFLSPHFSRMYNYL